MSTMKRTSHIIAEQNPTCKKHKEERNICECENNLFSITPDNANKWMSIINKKYPIKNTMTRAIAVKGNLEIYYTWTSMNYGGDITYDITFKDFILGKFQKKCVSELQAIKAELIIFKTIEEMSEFYDKKIYLDIPALAWKITYKKLVVPAYPGHLRSQTVGSHLVDNSIDPID